MASRFSMAAREVRGVEPAAVLAYHPVARLNPFQSLLYSSAFGAGFAPVGAIKMGDIQSLSVARAMGSRTVLHLHWTSGVIGSAETQGEAAERVDGFLSMLSDLKASDTATVWSVHNRLPHHCRFPAEETRLRRGIAEVADAIHIMEPTTVESVADVVELPRSKILVVPHPSYKDSYPRHYDRSLVRFELGIPQSAFVVGLIGSIQPYKGIDEFLDAVEGVTVSVPNLRALVAGIPGTNPESTSLVARMEAARSVMSLPTKVDDRNLSRLLSCLDAMVLPYRASLNSGAALLALTFGVPIIGPNRGPFVSLINAGFGLGYDPEDPSGLEEAIKDAPAFVEQMDQAAVAKYVESVNGYTISEQFFTRLRDVLGW